MIDFRDPASVPEESRNQHTGKMKDPQIARNDAGKCESCLTARRFFI
jgi:hypothetical protein